MWRDWYYKRSGNLKNWHFYEAKDSQVVRHTTQQFLHTFVVHCIPSDPHIVLNCIKCYFHLRNKNNERKKNCILYICSAVFCPCQKIHYSFWSFNQTSFFTIAPYCCRRSRDRTSFLISQFLSIQIIFFLCSSCENKY